MDHVEIVTDQMHFCHWGHVQFQAKLYVCVRTKVHITACVRVVSYIWILLVWESVTVCMYVII